MWQPDNNTTVSQLYKKATKPPYNYTGSFTRFVNFYNLKDPITVMSDNGENEHYNSNAELAGARFDRFFSRLTNVIDVAAEKAQPFINGTQADVDEKITEADKQIGAKKPTRILGMKPVWAATTGIVVLAVFSYGVFKLATLSKSDKK